MKIRTIELISCSFDLAHPYQVAYESFNSVKNLLLRIDTGTICGWGCAAPDPFVTGEDLDKMLPVLKEKLPGLLEGKDPFSRMKILDSLKKELPGYFRVWAAVDMALWDLLGKKAELPVCKILGGYRSRIETSITIGICDLHKTMEEAARFIREDFRIMKIKGGLDPEEDLIRLKSLRERYGKEVHLRFDANQGYSREQALYFLTEAGDLDLEVIEQPTRKGKPDLLGDVSARSHVPIMADESLISLMDAFHLARNGLVDMMNIKIMKVGGISEAVQVDSVARSAHITVMVGCMDESALGISAGLHFALSRKNIRFADLDGHLDLVGDPAAGTVIMKKGWLTPNGLPGLGWKGL